MSHCKNQIHSYPAPLKFSATVSLFYYSNYFFLRREFYRGILERSISRGKRGLDARGDGSFCHFAGSAI